MPRSESNVDNTQTRRVFIGGIAAFLTACGLIFVGAFRYVIPNVQYGKRERFKAGMPKDFPDKQATYLPDQQVFMVRDGDYFIVLSAVCTHLGCAVRSDPDHPGFFCPCHGSRFRPDGTNYAGPAPKPLEAYEVSLGNVGELIVDKRTLVSPKERFRI